MTPRTDGRRWSLDDLIPEKSGPGMERVFEDLEVAVTELVAQRTALDADMDPAPFQEILAIVERIGYRMNQLNGYAVLWYSELTSDQDALAFGQRVDKALADAQNRTLFFDLWWKKLDAKNADRLMQSSGDLRYYLESVRRFAPYTLSEAEEKVINIKNLYGAEGHVTIFGMITNAFTFPLEIDGEIQQLTRTELMVHVRDASPERRAEAYRSLHAVFHRNKDVLAQLYKYVVGDWGQENVTLRGMASPIAVRNLLNDVPDDAIDALLEACRENVGLFQRFFRLKARWIGMDKLRRYDLYAPLEAVDREYSFEEGVRQIMESLHGFSPELETLARRVLDEGHIDSQPRVGKDTGAFCFGVVPDKTPWVLVNYNGRADDVATLGHELGHAIHSMMAKDHSVLTFHSSLPLAETASNFVELLLINKLLDEEKDPAFRRYLTAKFVDDRYASILRQSYFVLFEREAHELINGAGATPDRLASAYLENLREQFGDSVEVSDDFGWEWVSIPHIYATPFYCYAYTFGLLLVLALYQRYREEGEAFVPKYLSILAYGGSKAPMAILDEAGFDVRSKSFWQGGFDVVGGMIDDLESLA